MKRRPRRIEQQVAEWVSAFSTSKGCRPVARIPVLGRTGPDIKINELGLVIDVKSRQNVPHSAFLEKDRIVLFSDGLLAVRLDELADLFDPAREPNLQRVGLATLWSWWAHMDEWRREFCPSGVSTLVVHRPGMPTRCCSVIISASERRMLYDRSRIGDL